MTAKKNGKTNKTAHVLNLLTSAAGDDAAQAGPEQPWAASAPPDSAPAPAPAPAPPQHLTPPILEEAVNREVLSEQIRAALEETLLSEAGSPPPQPAPPQPEPQPIPQASEPQPAPEPEPTSEPVPQPAPPQPEPVPPAPQPPSQEPSPPPPGPHALPDDQVYVNVMEALVEEKAQKYIQLFGLCGCSRCVADVKALALTNLPSQYAVMHKGEVVPMLTVYEGRHSAAITAQLMHACKVVMEHPRHAQ